MADQQAANAVIQAIIQAANAATANAAAAAAAAAPAAAVIAAWPGGANNNALDYNVAADLKVFNRSIEALPTKFDLKADKLKVFLECVKERALIFDWSAVITIPDTSIPPVTHDLIDEYGQVSLADCRASALTYLGVVPNTRNTQNSNMLYQFLSNSLTEDAKNVIQANPEAYTIIINNVKYPSGACLLKVIVGKSTIDTIATINVLRGSLARLDLKMVELGSDVKEFNLYVTQIRNSLIARGQVVPELMMHLFSGYAAASDEAFVLYMSRKSDAYDDGEIFDPDAIMSSALNKYQVRVEKGLWTANKKDDRIIALEAKIEEMQKKTSDSSNQSGNQNNKKKKKNIDFAWKKVPPKSGEKTKTVAKKVYYWCGKHEAWTIHTPEECLLPDKTASKGSPKMTHALQAVMSDDDESGEESE
jgi:hypothetical protein